MSDFSFFYNPYLLYYFLRLIASDFKKWERKNEKKNKITRSDWIEFALYGVAFVAFFYFLASINRSYLGIE